MARVQEGSKPNPRALTPKGLLASFGYAWAGLVYAWRVQPNFRVEVGIGTLALLLALALKVTLWSVLLLILIVLTLELVNTAMEALVDLVQPDYHPMAKAVKDTAAAAVLVASVIAAVIGLLLFLPPLIEVLR